MLMILIIGFTAGPAVSLYGSPTVSPVMAAIWASEPLPPWFPSSMYFFALSQAPPPAVMEMATKRPVTIVPRSIAPTVTNLPEPEPHDEPEPAQDTGLPAALCDDLRAVRTELVKSRLAENPAAALDLLVCHLAGKLLSAQQDRPALAIAAEASPRYPVRQDRHAEIEAVLTKDAQWKRRVQPPAAYTAATSRGARLAAIRAMDSQAKMKLLAGLVAMTLTPQLAFDDDATDVVEATIAGLGIDFATRLRPTKGLFWTQLTRERMLQIADKTLGSEWVARHRGAKKAELAQRMADAFGPGNDAPDIDAEARTRAQAWTMPGLKPFDRSERTRVAAEQTPADDGPQTGAPPRPDESAAEPKHELPSFME